MATAGTILAVANTMVILVAVGCIGFERSYPFRRTRYFQITGAAGFKGSAYTDSRFTKAESPILVGKRGCPH